MTNPSPPWGSSRAITGIQAIPTRYKGYHFRSRLEARWAVYFDAIGCKWEYEPQGFHLPDGTMYLPDFWLSSVNMWAEVKPTWPTDEEIQKAFLLAQGSGCAVLILDGLPRQTNYWAIENNRKIEDASNCSLNHFEPFWYDYFLTNQYLGRRHQEHRFYSVGWGMGDRFGPDRPNMIECDSDSDGAVEAARSARFEHGESGRP